MSLTQSIEHDGVITFWSLASHSNRSEMAALLALVDQKYAGMVPEERTLKTGLLADALKEVFPGRDGYWVSPTRKHNWVVKQEVITDDDVDLRYVCHVRVEEVLSTAGADPIERVEIRRGYTVELEQRLTEAVERQKGLSTAGQVSEMLTAVLKGFPGVVSLRPSGGIYVLTDDASQKTWRHISSALGHCGANGRANKVYRVDYKVNEHSIEAIRDALLSEVEQFSVSLESEIAESDPEKQLGARALKNRQKSAEDMLKRVEFLEGVLSTRLQDARDMVERVKSAAGQAALLSSISV